MLYKEEFETWAQNNDTKKDCPCLFKKHEYWHESHNDTIWPMCSFKYLDCKYKFSYRYVLEILDKLLIVIILSHTGSEEILHLTALFSIL